MVSKTRFETFMSRIRLQECHIEDAVTGHSTLRDRLANDEGLASIIVATILQGSYRRRTGIRPQGGKRADVDVVVVTNLVPDAVDSEAGTPAAEAIERFVPFVGKHYKGKWHRQGRSIGIELSYVDLDLVVTASGADEDARALKALAASDTDDVIAYHTGLEGHAWASVDTDMPGALLKTAAAEADSPAWKTAPLWLPDREAGLWEQTHPIAQITWTWEKNGATHGHYINVVKALKWWRGIRHPEAGRPKGYPLEHMIGDCCPDGIDSLEECITLTLERMRDDYTPHAELCSKPALPDRGLPEHDVLGRISVDEFAAFVSDVADAAAVAREALDATNERESALKWSELLGDKFPVPEPITEEYTPRCASPTTVKPARFA